jgi:hypothetical protein
MRQTTRLHPHEPTGREQLIEGTASPRRAKHANRCYPPAAHTLDEALAIVRPFIDPLLDGTAPVANARNATPAGIRVGASAPIAWVTSRG